MNFNIHIPTPTLKQAYHLFLQNISRIDWYEENGRPYFLQSLKQMNKTLINQMIEERDLLKTDENKYAKKFQQPFEKELYHPERYERLANEILSYNDMIDKDCPPLNPALSSVLPKYCLGTLNPPKSLSS